MAVFRKAAFAAMTSLACLPSIAEASRCWYPDEARAAQVRGLQTMLMVGTLQCRHRSRQSEHLYTDFIESQRGALDANSAILKARFERENGYGGGQVDYDRFGTALANRYSEQLNGPADCATVHRFAWLAARAGRQELLRLADLVAEPPVTGLCRPSYEMADRHSLPPRIAIADPAESAPAGAAPVMVADATGAGGKLERVLEAASPAATPDLPAPAEPIVQAASQIEIAPAPAPVPSRDDTLKAAIVALQDAVTALQAASVLPPAEPAGGAAVDAQAADPGSVVVVDVPAVR